MTPRSIYLMGGAAAVAVVVATVWSVRVFTTVDKAAPPSSIPDRAAVVQADLPKSRVAAPDVSAPISGRFKLVGVLVNGSESRALIAVDGQPARALRLGETVDGDLVVQKVSADGVTLGPHGGGPIASLQVAAATAPELKPGTSVTAPVVAEAAQFPNDGVAARAQPIREQGSKYAPITLLPRPASRDSAGSTTPTVDDGRWRPPSGQ